jgi:hypothetical protein
MEHLELSCTEWKNFMDQFNKLQKSNGNFNVDNVFQNNYDAFKYDYTRNRINLENSDSENVNLQLILLRNFKKTVINWLSTARFRLVMNLMML